VLALARTHGAGAVVIEDLDFVAWREEGRERSGRRPHGQARQGLPPPRRRAPDRQVSDRLVQMAANNGVAVIAVDPAYTSRWGAEHWLEHLGQISPEASGHHAAAPSSDDADSDIGHDDGKGVTRHEQCIVTRELPTPSCQVTAARTPNRRTGRQVGSPRSRQRTLPGERAPPATRRLRTVRGRPRAGISSAQCLGTVGEVIVRDRKECHACRRSHQQKSRCSRAH